ncbi:MAG TPA: hypothetical protein VMV69_08290 [Pirellulales bacterium]|nr:hypothetical protein [Pirellulales bacterium]
MRSEFQADLRASNKELIRAFKVMNESLLEDFRGAFLDRTEQQSERLDDHERRLVAVEGKLGIAA